MALPSVIKPRMIGQPIHLCFSDIRSNGSAWTITSPEALRQAIPQAWGDLIITPSSTACPPTRVVSSPFSITGKSCKAVENRHQMERNRISHLDDREPERVPSRQFQG